MTGHNLSVIVSQRFRTH